MYKLIDLNPELEITVPCDMNRNGMLEGYKKEINLRVQEDGGEMEDFDDGFFYNKEIDSPYKFVVIE